jgi:hypothetical protein
MKLSRSSKLPLATPATGKDRMIALLISNWAVIGSNSALLAK